MAATSPPIVSRSGPRWLAAPAAAAIFVAGVWVAGGVVASTFRAAMALTTLWYLVAGVLCVAVVRGRRSLRVPVLGGCAMAAVATGGWLAYSTLHERVVHERLSVGLQLAGGVFSSGEHATTGTARLIRLRDGRRVVTLSRFSTSPGPDLRVRLAPTGRGTGGGTSGVADLGGLKGNRGDQQYDVPASFAARGATVLIWCRAFSALFGSAVLEER